jgi:hypothetical protein
MSRITPFLGLTVLIAGVPALAQLPQIKPKGDDVLLTRKRDNSDATKPASKGVKWKFGFEKGRVTKFNEKVIIAGNLADGTGFTVEIKTISTETVKAVSKTGDGTVESRSEAGEATINGEPLPDSPLSGTDKSTTVIGANGLIVKSDSKPSATGLETIDKVAPIVMAMPTPPTPVVPGDEWKTEIDNPFLPEQKVVVTSQFEERGKFGTLIVYRVRVNALISVRENDEENADAIQVNGYYEFEPVKQRVVKLDTTVENLDLTFQGQKVRASVQGVLSMIGVPDQITPRTKPVKKKVKSKR